MPVAVAVAVAVGSECHVSSIASLPTGNWSLATANSIEEPP